MLVLLAANDPGNPDNARYQEKAQAWARDMILSPVEIQELKSDRTPGQGKVAWSHAFKLIVLAEYYLQTRDKAVFPTLEAYAICFAKNQSWFGTTGHQYAGKTHCSWRMLKLVRCCFMGATHMGRAGFSVRISVESIVTHYGKPSGRLLAPPPVLLEAMSGLSINS